MKASLEDLDKRMAKLAQHMTRLAERIEREKKRVPRKKIEDPHGQAVCVCGRIFTRIGFTKHSRVCEGKPPDARHSLLRCPLCERPFTDEASKRKHVRACRGGREVSEPPVLQEWLDRARAAIKTLRDRGVSDRQIAKKTDILELRLFDISNEFERVEIEEVEALERLAKSIE